MVQSNEHEKGEKGRLLNKDVLNIILEYASTLDYQTCSSIRLTCKRFAESVIIKQHMKLWRLIEGLNRIEDINQEMLKPRPRLSTLGLPFTNIISPSTEIILKLGYTRDYWDYIDLKDIDLKGEKFNFDVESLDENDIFLNLNIVDKNDETKVLKTYELGVASQDNISASYDCMSNILKITLPVFVYEYFFFN